MAQALLSPYQLKAKRGDTEAKSNSDHGRHIDREANQAYAKFAKGVKAARADADFDDPILF